MKSLPPAAIEPRFTRTANGKMQVPRLPPAVREQAGSLGSLRVGARNH